MGNRDHVTVSGNMQLQDGTNTFEINTDEAEGETLEGAAVVNGGDAQEGGRFSGAILSAGAVIAAAVLLTGILAALGIRRKCRGQRQGTAFSQGGDVAAGEPEKDESSPMGDIQVGKVHNIGKRDTQQDSMGVADVPEGVFAVVADGMGGLSDGDKVSQTIVKTMLQEVSGRGGGARLFEAVSLANDVVNQMLGERSQYVSGSTVVAALTGKGSFEWVSVGDSRVCLYRGGRLIQLNREHTYESELLWQAVNGEISFAKVQEDPKRRGLTSFIGMGRLKYIDGSLRPIETAPGDCLLLMSDGVFNTLSGEEICEILRDYPDPQRAARAVEERILEYDRPKQDNFTAVILKF